MKKNPCCFLFLLFFVFLLRNKKRKRKQRMDFSFCMAPLFRAGRPVKTLPPLPVENKDNSCARAPCPFIL